MTQLQLQLNFKQEEQSFSEKYGFKHKDIVRAWHDDDGDVCLILNTDPKNVRLYNNDNGAYIGIDRRKSTLEYLKKEGYDGLER